MGERPRPTPTQKDIKQSTQYGGADTDFNSYQQNDQLNYCDKGGHKIRSEVNQPSHFEHWKKHGA